MFDLQHWACLALGCVAVWLIYRIFQLVKAIHFMIHDDFKRQRPEAFRDD